MTDPSPIPTKRPWQTPRLRRYAASAANNGGRTGFGDGTTGFTS